MPRLTLHFQEQMRRYYYDTIDPAFSVLARMRVIGLNAEC